MTIACRRYRVSGLVQGVGFRYSAQREALRLGLTGWVRNLLGGGVEAVACGYPSELEAFRSWLERGPAMARVRSVEEERLAEASSFRDFSIR